MHRAAGSTSFVTNKISNDECMFGSPTWRSVVTTLATACFVVLLGTSVHAATGQEAISDAQPTSTARPAGSVDGSKTAEQRITELTQEVDELKALVLKLQDQVSKLAGAAPSSPVAAATASQAPPATAAPVPSSPAISGARGILDGTTINAMLDGYYEYNFNSPLGRVNNLRAYDVSSNSFSLNQADLVIERAANLAFDTRLGLRLDFQFGQATSTLQGNPANELRPEVYRNVFQAYGTYVFPVANGP